MFKHKLVKIIIGIILFFLLVFILLWVFSFKKYNVDFGISFSKEYSQSLGLDWKETYNAIISDLKPKYIRLTVPWSEVEKQMGVYNFDDIDYQMNEAEKNNVKVILVLGQKIPRWPECFIPSWADSVSSDIREDELFSYINNTVKRYKNYKSLEYWQVENEPFIQFRFGECKLYDQKLVNSEVDKVRELDPNRKIIITDSGELSSWYRASKSGDILGTTLYRVVRTPNDFIIRYNIVPPAFYKFRARLWNKGYSDFFIAELQAEPWFTGSGPVDTPIITQMKTGSLSQIKENISYANYVGASRAYLWGVEWWYFMKQKQNDSSYWDEIKIELRNNN